MALCGKAQHKYEFCNNQLAEDPQTSLSLTTSQKEAEKKYKAKLHVRKEWLLYHIRFNLSQLLTELLVSSADADLIYRLITRAKVLWLSVQKSIRNEILCPPTY